MSNSEAQPEQRLRPVVEALRQGLGADLTALALFGSRARGDATPLKTPNYTRLYGSR